MSTPSNPSNLFGGSVFGGGGFGSGIASGGIASGGPPPQFTPDPHLKPWAPPANPLLASWSMPPNPPVGSTGAPAHSVGLGQSIVPSSEGSSDDHSSIFQKLGEGGQVDQVQEEVSPIIYFIPCCAVPHAPLCILRAGGGGSR
jgi:hypothetical protein